MANMIGLFEDILHVDAFLVQLKNAGFTDEQVSILSKEGITRADSINIYEKRTGDISSIFGMLGGGYVGMAVGAGVLAILSLAFGVIANIFATLVTIIIGGAIGAALGAYVGNRFVPSLLSRFGVFEDSFRLPNRAVKRDGILVAVEVNKTNMDEVEKMMNKSQVINIREQTQHLELEDQQELDEDERLAPT